MMHTHKGKTNKYPILAPPIRCLHGFPLGLALQKHSGGINPTDRHTLCYFRIGYFIFIIYPYNIYFTIQSVICKYGATFFTENRLREIFAC
jgi:hypothetical protein